MATAQLLSSWPGTMTARERFCRQMHFQRVDRSFNMEFGYWEENFQLWPMFRENGITNNEEAHRFFGFDPIAEIFGNIFLSPAFEHKVLDKRNGLLIIQNSEGLLAEIPEDQHASIPHYLKSSITTPDDWKKCKELRFRRDDPARIVDIEALKKLHPADRNYPLGVNCGSMIGRIRDILTFEGLAYACCDYPDMVEDMVETCCLLVEDFLDQVLPHFDFDFASGWEDICFRSGPLITMDFFEQVIMPRYQRIHRKLMAHNIDLWYTDCDGDVRPLLKGFMASGINCLFPYEVMSCVHPKELLDAHPNLRIMGGVDKIEMAKGPEAIKRYLESLIPCVERGGYIPFCDHRCPPDVSQENYLYYLNLKKELFG